MGFKTCLWFFIVFITEKKGDEKVYFVSVFLPFKTRFQQFL